MSENPYAPPEADVEVPNRQDGELASRGARLGGAIIDGLLAMVLFWGAVFAFGYWDDMSTGVSNASDSFVLVAIWLGIFLLLNGYLLATRGQTIGKVAVGTRIVSVADGKILPLWKIVALRILPFTVVGVIPAVGQLVGFINPLFIFAESRRCLHDYVAGTKVVVANPVAA